MPIIPAATRNTLATAYGTASPYSALMSALTLQAIASSGATTFSSDLSVGVGDTVVLGQGTGTQESRVVSAVSGSGPYTVTVPALTNTHPSGELAAHLPITLANGHEITGGSPAYARKANTWTPSGGVNSGTAVTFDVPTGAKVGSLAQMSASTAGTLVDVDVLPNPQSFASQGTLTATPTYTQT
jgi:hypothetical protein